MTAWRPVALVAWREIRERGRSKAFLISTALIVAGAIALATLPDLVNPSVSEHVGVVAPVPPAFAAALQAATADSPRSVTTDVMSYADTAAARQALQTRAVDVIWDPNADQLLWRTEPLQPTEAHVRRAIAAVTLEQRAAAQGLSPTELARLLTPPTATNASVEATDTAGSQRQAVATIGTVVLFMAIVLAGNFVVSGVIEEKTTRTVEVLLAQVRPHELLAGKVLGIGALALAQLLTVIVAGLTAGAIAGTVSLSAVGVGAAINIIGWFILGFGFYAVAYAAAGALVDRQEDSQAVIYPVLAPLILGYIVALTATSEPDLPLARWLSLLPPTAPAVMPIRIQMGVATAPEILIAVLGTIAGAYALIRLGGRVYAGAILHTGGRVRLTDAIRTGRNARAE